jgi:cell wall-associated NlpC family hydrolase
VLVPFAAQAIPTPATPTVADVTAKLTQLAVNNEKLTEQLNAAKISVDRAQARQRVAAAAAATAEARLHQTQNALASSVAAQYKASSVSSAAALLTSKDGKGYVETLESLDVLANHQADIAQAAKSASDDAARANAEAKSALDDAVAEQNLVTTQQAKLSKEIAKYQQVLDTLTAAQVAAYHARENAASTAVAKVLPTISVKASGRAATAVQAALTRRGDPYVWGAAGPDAFDCSGLTSWAWAQAGVSLPHNAAAQQGLGTPVPADKLAPGDLVFFGSPAYHVGMYIGDGLYVQAPTSGDVVKVSVLSNASDYSGATRVG